MVPHPLQNKGLGLRQLPMPVPLQPPTASLYSGTGAKQKLSANPGQHINPTTMNVAMEYGGKAGMRPITVAQEFSMAAGKGLPMFNLPMGFEVVLFTFI